MSYSNMRFEVKAENERAARKAANAEVRNRNNVPISIVRISPVPGNKDMWDVQVLVEHEGAVKPKKKQTKKPTPKPAPKPAAKPSKDESGPKKKRTWLNKLKGEKSE